MASWANSRNVLDEQKKEVEGCHTRLGPLGDPCKCLDSYEATTVSLPVASPQVLGELMDGIACRACDATGAV